LETYKKFEEFVRGGGVLIATKSAPQSVPGFLATQKDHEQIVEISSRLFGNPKSSARLVTDEKLQLGRTLNQLSPPDVGFSVPLPEVGFIHRRTNDAEVYFIANTSNAVQRAEITIREPGMKAEEWNPITGAVSGVKAKSTEREHSILDLSLAPYESRMFVFTKRMLPYKEPQNVKVPSPIDMSSEWQVSIGTNAPTNWPRLRSWTEDESTRYFSGTASYTKNIQVPAEMKQQGLSLELQLGDGIPITPQTLRNGSQAWLEGPVREAAVIYINDKRAGAIWCSPYLLDLTSFLKVGANKIRIEVANTAMNYMAGHSLPDYRLLNLRYGERFQAQDMDKIQALPSGLLGTVRLVASAK
jgi:hypothetical protein